MLQFKTFRFILRTIGEAIEQVDQWRGKVGGCVHVYKMLKQSFQHWRSAKVSKLEYSTARNFYSTQQWRYSNKKRQTWQQEYFSIQSSVVIGHAVIGTRIFLYSLRLLLATLVIGTRIFLYAVRCYCPRLYWTPGFFYSLRMLLAIIDTRSLVYSLRLLLATL
jgi:hypothetical protein